MRRGREDPPWESAAKYIGIGGIGAGVGSFPAGVVSRRNLKVAFCLRTDWSRGSSCGILSIMSPHTNTRTMFAEILFSFFFFFTSFAVVMMAVVLVGVMPVLEAVCLCACFAFYGVPFVSVDDGCCEDRCVV